MPPRGHGVPRSRNSRQYQPGGQRTVRFPTNPGAGPLGGYGPRGDYTGGYGPGSFDVRTGRGNYQPSAAERQHWSTGPGLAQYLRAEQSRIQRLEKLRSDAKRYAALYNERARALIAAANGRRTALGDRLGSYYGLDLSTKEGRAAAATQARRLRDLANNSYQDQGAAELVAYEEGSRKQLVRAANDRLDQAERALRQAKRGRNAFESVFKNPLQALGDLLGSNGYAGVARRNAGLGYYAGETMKLADPVLAPVQNAYYAGKYTQLQGGSLLDQTRALVGGLPGLGFTAGDGQLRRNIEATNTRGEREGLRQQGELLSFGEAVMGDYTGLSTRARELALGSQIDQSTANRINTRRVNKQLSFELDGHRINIGSGLFDAAFQIGQDPTLAIGKGLQPLRNISKALSDDLVRAAVKEGVSESGARAFARAARINFIENSRLGSVIVNETVDAAAAAGTPERILTIMGKNTPRQLAHDVFRAGQAGGSEAVARALRDAFVSGVWQPQRSVVARVAGSLGISLSSGHAPLATRLVDLLQDAQSARKTRVTAANPVTGEVLESAGRRALRAPLSGSSIDKVMDWAVLHAATTNKTFGGNLLRRFSNETAADAAMRANALLTVAEESSNAGFRHMVDEATAVLNTSLFEDLDNVAQATFLARMEKLEAIGAVLKGAAGPDAQQLVSDQLLRQFTIAGAAETVGTRSVRKAVQQLTSANIQWQPSTYRRVSRDVVETVLDELPEGPLKDALRAQLAATKDGTKVYGQVAAAIDAASASPRVLDDATRAIELYGERQAVRDVLLDAARQDGASLLARMFSKPSQMLLSLIEKAPQAVFHAAASPHAGINQQNIAEFMDRYAGALHLSSAERKSIYTEAEEVARHVAAGGSPQRAIDFHNKIVRLAWEKAGLPREEAEAWAKEMAREALEGRVTKPAQAFSIARDQTTEELELLNRPQLAAQAQTTFTVAEVETIREGIRKELARAGLGSRFNDVRVAWDNFKNLTLWVGKNGAKHTIKGGYRTAYGFWKAMVTTRVYLAPLIIAGGLVAGADLWTTLEFAAVGGGLGWVRYRTRNSLQNRLNAVLEHGTVPEEWIPGLTSIFRRTEKPVYGSSWNALFPDPTTSFFNSRVGAFVHEASDVWKVAAPAGRKAEKEYLRGYFRVLNYQLNPETDEVVRLVLQHKAGYLDDVGLDGALREFFTTEDGALWLEKMRGIGAKNRTRAVKQVREFIDQYVPTSDVAAARLDPAIGFGPNRQLSTETIANWSRGGHLAEAVHVQQTQRILNRGWTGMWDQFKHLFDFAAYDSARVKGFRHSFFSTEAKIQEANLRAAGVTGPLAREIAGEVATRRTNQLLFRFDNASRFAHTIDWIAPFTGDKQFSLQTLTKLALENPGRTVRLGYRASLAFNAGRTSGILQQDPYGNYRFTVPGSGPLSRALFGPIGDMSFKANVAGFMSLTSDLTNATGQSDNPLMVGSDLFGPRPGGIWWAAAGRALREVYPDLMDPNSTPLPKGVYNYFFPYGPNAAVIPPQASRMLRAVVGTEGPWWVLDDEQGAEELHRWEVQVAKDLIAEHRKAHPDDLTWFPSGEQVKERTLALFQAWSFLSAVFPASPFPVYKNKAEFEELWNQWYSVNSGTYNSFSEARRAFVDRYPAYAPFLDRTTKYIGDDDFEEWEKGTGARGQQADLDAFMFEKFTKERKYISLKEYRQDFKEFRRMEEAGRAFRDALATPNALEREEALVAWRDKYPDQARKFRVSNNAERELAHILEHYPKNMRDQAIDRWRRDYAPPGQSTVSRTSYLRMRESIRNNISRNLGTYRANPWEVARDSEDVWRDVTRRTGSSNPMNWKVVQTVQTTLSPAEQVKFWQQAMMRLQYETGSTQDAGKVLDAYNFYKRSISDVYANNPELRRSSKDPHREAAYAEVVKKANDDEYRAVSALYSEIAEVKLRKDQAAKSKQWAVYYQLKSKEKALYDLIRDTKSAFWNRQTDSIELHNAVAELTYFTEVGADPATLSRLMKKVQAEQRVPYAPSNEQARWNAMPRGVQSAQIDLLVRQLSIPPGQSKVRWELNQGGEDLPFKLYWEYLTDFQKDLIERNVPHHVVEGWKAQDAEVSEAAAKALRSGGGGRRYGSRRSYGSGELSFALGLMRQYNRRGGMAKPAAYDEYLRLPANPAVRNEFLDKHPEVAEYIKAGPMANMPPLYAMMVQDIMIRHGRWEGEPRDIGAITDIAFAREQLQRYNRRTGPAPATYDLWLNMPSGQAKADYLNAHPEIRQWLQLGPMANMPEIYRDVVRDIMYRYHEWTAATDGMGLTISEYFRTPSYAREQFLAEHPELAAYWQATRSQLDPRMNELVDSYYAIPDVGARKAFLASHPELQRYFVDARTRRYERFLNQVAQYMGQSPELFEAYLQRQNEVLEDLLSKFAEPNIARERHWMRPDKARTTSAEGGRRRS